MYTVHCENTLRLKLSSESTMNHLIDFGVCALVGCTNYIFYIITFKRYFKCIVGVEI